MTRALLARTAYELKTAVARHTAIALPLARWRGHGEVVSPRTEVVIEGFPRCASSFAVAAFRLAQEPHASTIAHHTHAPSQVLAGVRAGIPTIVLIRDPEDAVISHVIRSPHLTLQNAVRGFVRFYEPLLPVLDRVVVGTFNQVVSEFGTVIARANTRFETSFGLFEATQANVDRVMREIEEDYERRIRSKGELERVIPRPSADRDRLKRELRVAYPSQVSERLRSRARSLFESITERALE